MARAPQVILWDQSSHRWEVWQQSRAIAEARLATLCDRYPRALPVSDHQLELAAHDGDPEAQALLDEVEREAALAYEAHYGPGTAWQRATEHDKDRWRDKVR